MRHFPALGTTLFCACLIPASSRASDIVLLRRIGIEAEAVVLQLSAQTRYSVLPIVAPPQLVIDLADTRNRAQPRVVQGRGLIRRVRSSQFQPGPDWAARVVVDLAQMAAYQVGWRNGILRVKLLGPSSDAPQAAEASSAPAAPAAEPASPEPPRKARKAAITAETKAEPAGPGPLPGQASAAPAPAVAEAAPQEAERKPAQFFLKVGPFPSEEEMKTANGLISSLGYPVSPGNGTDGRSQGN
jgi:hypothetical protein